jgi:hypothetical protein
MRIVVASMGRCGSTALFNSLREQLGSEFQTVYLKEYRSHHFLDDNVNYLIKTHDVARNNRLTDSKVIYLFSSPYDVINSFLAQSKKFKVEGFPNFGFNDYKSDSQLLNFDGLNLEYNFESWYYSNNKVLFIHYDALFESANQISLFLGREITLPKRVKRKTVIKFTPECYHRLNSFVLSLEKVFIND